MLIKIGFDIAYTAPQPTPMVVMLGVHPSRVADLIAPENIVCKPPAPIHFYHDSLGNFCGRLVIPTDRAALSNRVEFAARPVQNLPNDVILFVFANRYCETDEVGEARGPGIAFARSPAAPMMTRPLSPANVCRRIGPPEKGRRSTSKKVNLGKTMKRMLAATLTAVALVSTVALADEYPSRTVRVLTTSSAGGLSDIFMRALADKLRPRLGQSIIVENRPGGAGNIALRACSEAKPDGYTVCIIDADPLIYNEFLYKNLTYDPHTGVTPIIQLFNLIQALVVNSDLKVRNVDELVALSKRKKGTLSYLTASLPLVVFMEHLKRDKGADWVRVPFRGGGEATTAVLSGSTPIALLGIGNVMSYIRAGKMTALALGNNIRTPQLPDVPTLADTGYKGPPSRSWYGLFAPGGTPKPIIERINAEVTQVFADKDFIQKNLTNRGLVPAIGTPAAFAEEIKAGRATGAQVVKDSGLEMQ